jgi:hypothetical protein
MVDTKKAKRKVKIERPLYDMGPNWDYREYLARILS